MLPALILLLMNATAPQWPPVLKQPLIQAIQLPLPVGGRPIPISLPSPPCTVNPGAGEGSFFNQTLICRDLPDGTSSNTSFPLTQVQLDTSTLSWSKESIAYGNPIPAQVSSANLKSVQTPQKEEWFLLAYPGAGTVSAGGNGGGGTWLVWLEPVRSTPTVLYDGNGTYTFQDIQLTRQGLFILARNTLSPAPGGIYGLVESGILWWPPDKLPRRPLQPLDFTWLPGTNSIRQILAFGAPSDARGGLFTLPSTAPLVVEGWNLDPASSRWNVSARYPISYAGQPLQIMPPTAQTPLLLLTTRNLIQVAPTAVVILTQPSTSSFNYRSISLGSILDPTPPPSSTVTGSPSAPPSPIGTQWPTVTADVSASASASASASVSASTASSASPTASATASTASSATSSATASAIASTLYLRTPSSQATSSIITSITTSATTSATTSVTSSASASSNPIPGPAANAINDSPNAARDLGLGLGLTTAFIAIAALLLGCFGQHLIKKAVEKFKYHVLKRRTAPRPRHPTRPKITTDANTIVLSMNPAMIQQQSAMDMLQMARQQRLEAAQLAQQQLEHETSLQRAKSFKQMYRPQRAPGSSV